MSHSVIASPGTFRPMIRLVIPVLIENSLHVLVEYTDLFLTGNFLQGAHYVAAMTVAGFGLWLFFNLFAFLSLGATAMTARFTGAGEPEQANQLANQAITTGLAWALVLMVLGQLLLGRFIGWMQLEEAAATAAINYLRIILLILPAMAIEEVGIACLRGAGQMVTGLVVMAIVNLINVVVASSLLLGLGPLPQLGWIGLAIGAACGHGVGGLIVLWLLWRGHAGYHLQLRLMRPNWSLIRRLLRIGLPGGFDLLAIVICQFWFLSIISQLGTIATAAHGVGVRIEAMAYMPGLAFQIAAATLVGQYLGARDPHRATRSIVLACATGGSIMVTVGTLFYFCSYPLAQFFLGDSPEIIPVSARLLRIVALSMPGLALTMIITGALRGAGDTRFPLAITFVGMLGVRIPLAYLLAHETLYLPGTSLVLTGYGLGVIGAWYAMVADIYVRCLLITIRFLHGGWKRIRV